MKYLAYYAPFGKEEEQKREATLSAVTKIDYICTAINRLGCGVEILSASRTTETRKIARGVVKRLKDGVSVKYLFSTPTGNILKRIIRTIVSNVLLFVELLKVKKNENIQYSYKKG